MAALPAMMTGAPTVFGLTDDLAGADDSLMSCKETSNCSRLSAGSADLFSVQGQKRNLYAISTSHRKWLVCNGLLEIIGRTRQTLP
jgi:hypothetical protein